jgi:hypothetical protein
MVLTNQPTAPPAMKLRRCQAGLIGHPRGGLDFANFAAFCAKF